jgi:hypothetical protein
MRLLPQNSAAATSNISDRDHALCSVSEIPQFVVIASICLARSTAEAFGGRMILLK